MPFHLIKFQMNGDIAVVPSGWYDDGMVFWPSYKNTDRVKRAALNEEQHAPNWPRYDVSVVRTCDHYKDALKIMQRYRNGCNTSDLQYEAENEVELPEKKNRKPVNRLGDSNDSEEDPGHGDLASLGLASQLHWQTPHHGEGRIHMPSPAPALNMQRVTQGKAVPPRLPPPPAPALNRPTRRGERMADNVSCSATEVQILSLLETIKHTQDQLVAKVNFLTSRLTSTPGPEVEMPANIRFPLEQLEAVETFETFLKEPSNGPARQRVISSLATIGGQDVKRVTWNILGRIFTDEVSHQISWKGVNNKKAFSRMATKTLLFSTVRKNVVTRSATDAEVTKHAIRWFNLAADRAARRRVVLELNKGKVSQDLTGFLEPIEDDSEKGTPVDCTSADEETLSMDSRRLADQETAQSPTDANIIELAQLQIQTEKRSLESIELDIEIKKRKLRKLDREMLKLEHEASKSH
ncbi:uncharacterized protein [Nerophis lumbriciformis]|uniref:uncharacterized protein isoform X2 n=1 Tax=Nerophis lumbriciformis TaxID=546530 RepID=UPI002ADF024E|nr:uncharacterized protein LOC133617434 isoform X2 [Nerophis lumbriciformis]